MYGSTICYMSNFCIPWLLFEEVLFTFVYLNLRNNKSSVNDII